MGENSKEERLQKVIAYGFIAFISSVLLLDALNPFATGFSVGSWKDWTNGRATKRLNEYLVNGYSLIFNFRKILSEWIFDGLGETNQSVTLGLNDWILGKKEVQDRLYFGSRWEDFLKRQVDYIEKANKTLQIHNQKVIMAVYPNRLMIYPEKFFENGRVPTFIQGHYLDFIRELGKRGIDSVNLEQVFLDAKKRDAEEGLLYLNSDYHCTRRGYQIASDAAIGKIQKIHPEWCNSNLGNVRLGKIIMEHGYGEFYSDLDLRVSDRRFIFIPNTKMIEVDYLKSFSPEDRRKSPVVMLSDSFGYKMPPYLEYYFQGPIYAFPAVGGKAHVALDRWLASGEYMDNQPRIIIWVFCYIYIPNNYLYLIDEVLKKHPSSYLKTHLR